MSSQETAAHGSQIGIHDKIKWAAPEVLKNHCLPKLATNITETLKGKKPLFPVFFEQLAGEEGMAVIQEVASGLWTDKGDEYLNHMFRTARLKLKGNQDQKKEQVAASKELYESLGDRSYLIAVQRPSPGLRTVLKDPPPNRNKTPITAFGMYGVDSNTCQEYYSIGEYLVSTGSKIYKEVLKNATGSTKEIPNPEWITTSNLDQPVGGPALDRL
jgi:hypothetical protein